MQDEQRPVMQFSTWQVLDKSFDCTNLYILPFFFFVAQASQLEMFDSHFYWIVIVNSMEQYKSIIQLLSILNISINSRVTVFWMKIDVRKAVLYEIW